MKFRDSDFQIIEQGPGVDGGFKMIEKISRTCYQSENKTTDTSYTGFVERMKNSKHYAMLEFFTVYLKFTGENVDRALEFYDKNPYSKINLDSLGKTLWVTTNYRVLIENNLEKDLEFICPIPEKEHHHERTTIRLFISRGVSHECVRHRVASYAQSSQRYICYSKERFGGEVEFIIPDKFYRLRDEYSKTIDPLTKESREYLKDLEGEELVNALVCIDRGAAAWYNHMSMSESDYKYLTLEEDWSAQDARDVLPNATSTILNICMFNEDWMHFFDLRSLGKTGKPHPDMKRISDKVLSKMIEEGILKEEDIYD